MLDIITSFIESIGYLGIGLLMFIETFLPPVQSEIVMPFSGFTASHSSDFHIFGIIAAGIVGSEVGALSLYLLASRMTYERVSLVLCKYGGWLGFTKDKLDYWGDKFNAHPTITIIIGRFIPGLRSFIAIPAGIKKVRFSVFAFANLAGTTFWVSVLAVGGFLLQNNYQLIAKYSSIVTYVFFGVIASYVLFRLIKRNVR